MVRNMPRHAEPKAGARLDTLLRSLAQQTGVSVSSAWNATQSHLCPYKTTGSQTVQHRSWSETEFFEMLPSQDVYWRNWFFSHSGNDTALFHDTGHTNSQNTIIGVHEILSWSVKCYTMMLEFSYTVLWMPLGFFFSETINPSNMVNAFR